MTVSDLLEQPCNRSDNHQQGYYKLLTACCIYVDNLGQAVRTQLVDGLLADLLAEIFACVDGIRYDFEAAYYGSQNMRKWPTCKNRDRAIFITIYINRAD